MNERIIELAEQAGLSCESNGSIYALTNYLDCLKHFAELVRQDEREQCAKFFDANNDLLFWGSAAAKAIRERTEPKSDFKTQMNDNWAGLI